MSLTRFELRWAVAAMEAIFPGCSDTGLSDIRVMNVDGFLRELMAHLPIRAALGVRLAVWLVALAPLFVLQRVTTIARLALNDREQVIATLGASKWYPIRSLVLVLKTMGGLLYAADDDVRMHMRPREQAVARLRVKRLHTV
jgi:hypothetical protein